MCLATFKLKRNIAKQRFQELIDEMYADPAVGSVAGLVGLKQGASSANAKKVAAGGAGAE